MPSKLSCLEAIEYVCLRFDAVQLNEITAKLELLSSLTEAMNILNAQVRILSKMDVICVTCNFSCPLTIYSVVKLISV